MPLLHVALIMRPWVVIMGTLGAACWILADDVLIIAEGQLMVTTLARALNFTHNYLQTMGPRVAPDTTIVQANQEPINGYGKPGGTK